MKKIIVLVALFLLAFGCARFQHSETINVDRYGAVGNYQDSRSGRLYNATLAGGGGGAGLLGFGTGVLGLNIVSNQSQSDPRNFAKAVAAIDMAKKLKYAKYDEETGIHEYEFIQPLSSNEKNTTRGSQLPPSYGRQPVQ